MAVPALHLASLPPDYKEVLRYASHAYVVDEQHAWDAGFPAGELTIESALQLYSSCSVKPFREL